ncbi:hypothetical protein CJ485_00110 [Priestia filamentosa]|nr:hypothetical protein CJ485_00110 [Priestia filamentosa]
MSSPKNIPTRSFQSSKLYYKPEGRFQIFTNYPSHQIILDYAHTPEALESLIKTVKYIFHKRLILMVKGVGLRDPKQHPFIEKSADRKADEIVVTVDHPGSYNRRNIAEDVMKGFSSSSVHVELHRERGIHKALSLVGKDDLIVLTGLGFGGYQVIRKENVPYCEYDAIHQYFNKKFSYKKERSKLTVLFYKVNADTGCSKYALYRDCTALFSSVSFTPNIILTSEDPWLISSRFTPASANAFVALAATPTELVIPSPTTIIKAKPYWTLTSSTFSSF